MGFDKDDPTPLVKPQRRTTKVNVSMAIGIIAFFIIAGLVVWRMAVTHGS